MHRPSAIRRRTRGFSLLEMSVVLAIISVIAVLGLEGLAIFMNRSAYTSSQERMQVIKTALAKHRYVYGYLPCPAGHTLGAGNVNYGKELRSGADCGSSTLTASIYYGDVPVRDLNLPLSYLKDGFGSRFRYAVTASMTRPGTSAGRFGHTNSTAAIRIRTGKIEEPCTSNCQQLSMAAYVLLSFGEDRRGTTATNCAPNANFDGMIDSVNCRFGNGQTLRVNGAGAVANIGNDVFYDSRFNNGDIEQLHFDDLIIWQTKGQL